MMKKPIQLSFTVMIIFTILVLVVVANEGLGKPKQCHEILKQSNCVAAECDSMCVKKRGKGAGVCTTSKKCYCYYHCP
ncbi:S locus-related glycoprotein 1 binding pollen coat protein [Arabidopsis thaliana x Arabidopsis arenosa]|uniref:S locus-related glycoprotein 1 binding pollen coat protein n=1 Tax=Arabidopsis thaliana x Arabidopsis arenosa TaxID=1240361 RepID=A0A8T2A468_9BRAS|nr:S locus-related glycoprotein 1 binding pollen coat protein [Arabidopsis thaliana x Arabidopsis arenosa]